MPFEGIPSNSKERSQNHSLIHFLNGTISTTCSDEVTLRVARRKTTPTTPRRSSKVISISNRVPSWKHQIIGLHIFHYAMLMDTLVLLSSSKIYQQPLNTPQNFESVTNWCSRKWKAKGFSSIPRKDLKWNSFSPPPVSLLQKIPKAVQNKDKTHSFKIRTPKQGPNKKHFSSITSVLRKEIYSVPSTSWNKNRWRKKN